MARRYYAIWSECGREFTYDSYARLSIQVFASKKLRDTFVEDDWEHREAITYKQALHIASLLNPGDTTAREYLNSLDLCIYYKQGEEGNSSHEN